MPTRKASGAELALTALSKITEKTAAEFRTGRRILSFQEYLGLFSGDPKRYGRDAGRYVRDAFDHYGTQPVERPWGTCTRFRLFDLPWQPERERVGAVVGHEEIQEDIYRSLCNFVGEGRANRLILLHGPNGSAKSTIAGCILQALEHYSTLDEGALYRFHWIFPSKLTTRGAIGFSEARKLMTASGADQSYAHLEEGQIDARLVIELRDHPLFLIPRAERRGLLEQLYAAASAGEAPPAFLLDGSLCHKNEQIFQALLLSYGGDLAEVLRHVQVERYFISRRYRLGAVTIGPEISVDARERQVTADRSLSALPTALQATTLWEVFGELVDAAGGVLEFSDLLKRPLDAYRYLQLTLETGEVSLPQQTVATNVVMIGSANEVHLNAFREHPEFASFIGRVELLRAPYLRSFADEQKIYDTQIVPQVRRHVAPHATRVAAQFAVLTRMMQPEAKRYPDAAVPWVSALTAVEKAELFATGQLPERMDADAQKQLAALVGDLYREREAEVEFEGLFGVSPREIRAVLLNAGQSPAYRCLSPFAVLLELDELCKRTAEFDWLRVKPLSGGYHDHKHFRDIVRSRLLDTIEGEMRAASGLVDETSYEELFDRYVTHVNAWVAKEKVRHERTGEASEPDERLMKNVEEQIGVRSSAEEHRKDFISRIAAWAIDHPGQKVRAHVVFEGAIRRMREAAYTERKRAVAQLVRRMVELTGIGGASKGNASEIAPAKPELGDDERRAAEAALQRLKAVGYCEACAGDAGMALIKARYADLL